METEDKEEMLEYAGKVVWTDPLRFITYGAAIVSSVCLAGVFLMIRWMERTFDGDQGLILALPLLLLMLVAGAGGLVGVVSGGVAFARRERRPLLIGAMLVSCIPAGIFLLGVGRWLMRGY